MAARNRKRIPDPPPINARTVDIEGVAGFFGKPRSWVYDRRSNDKSFPRGFLVSPGSPRWLVSDLEEWLRSRPRGWSSTGGLRPGAFRKKDSDELPMAVTTADEKAS